MLISKHKLFLFVSSIIVIAYFFGGCSATPTSDRFGKYKGDQQEEGSSLQETFEMAKFPVKLSLPPEPAFLARGTTGAHDGFWLTYQDDPLNRIDVNKVKKSGFRVLVKTTKNSEEADSLKSYLYFMSGRQSSYVDYDPPLYKIKLGDYTKQSNARDALHFVSQLGFKNAIVISDSILVTVKQ